MEIEEEYSAAEKGQSTKNFYTNAIELKRTRSFSKIPQKSQSMTNVNYDELYHVLAEYLPEKEYTRKEIAFYMFCGVLATLSSLYYFIFSTAYIQSVASRWGFDELQAKFFGDFCGAVSVVTNTAINSISIKLAWDIILAQVGQKLAAKNKRTDDNSGRVTTVFNLVLSAIGAIPNGKFVYDASKGNNIAYLVFMEIVQFVVVTALNFRGLHNISTAKFRKEQDSIAYCLKKELLENLNNMLTTPSQLDAKKIECLSHGDLVNKKLSVLSTSVGLLLGAYTIVYSSAFYFAVQAAMPTTHFGNPLDDIIKFAETGCGILSSGLKFVFLGYAYYRFVDKMFSLFYSYILTTNGKKVSADFITQNGQRWLALFGGVAAALTLGSSSRIVEKYFFGALVQTAQTFWLSFGLGGIAAYAINAGDLLALFERLINFVVHVFRTRILRYDPSYRFGNTHDEMVMQIMLKIVTTSDTDFLKKYTNEYTDKEPIPEDVEETDKTALVELTKHGHFYHNYSTNTFFKKLVDTSKGLKKVKGDTQFLEFKKHYRNEYENKKGQEATSEKAPLLSSLSNYSYSK